MTTNSIIKRYQIELINGTVLHIDDYSVRKIQSTDIIVIGAVSGTYQYSIPFTSIAYIGEERTNDNKEGN